MSFATEGSNVSADDFTLKLQDGIAGKITISELDGISTITANPSIVPEPAEIAAAIGLAQPCLRRESRAVHEVSLCVYPLLLGFGDAEHKACLLYTSSIISMPSLSNRRCRRPIIKFFQRKECESEPSTGKAQPCLLYTSRTVANKKK